MSDNAIFHQPIRDQYLGSREQCTANQRPVFRLHGDHVTVLFFIFHQPIRDQYLGSREQCTANQRPVFRLHGDHVTVMVIT